MTTGHAPVWTGAEQSTATDRALHAAARVPARTVLAGLGTALPHHRITTDDVALAMPRVWPHLARRMGTLLPQLIGYERHLVRPLEEMGRSLRLAEQTSRYLSAGLELAVGASRRALRAAAVDPMSIGCLVVTSCTGFVLPGLDARLVPVLGLRDDIVRLPLTQLGCAGGAAGMSRAADWVRAHPRDRALVVAVELPSVTFRAGDTSLDNLLSAMVFGDGAGAAVLTGGAGTLAATSTGEARAVPTIERTWSILLPSSTAALGYEMADDGYRVILSRTLPEQLETALPAVIRRCLGDGGAEGFGVVAAHPGGPAILESVQRALGVEPQTLAASWAALRHTGNTSSAAVFFVLEELQRQNMCGGTRGLLLAFGPGLTVELLELEWRG
jgi:alkylresorcinol/alkylpyrone synthase